MDKDEYIRIWRPLIQISEADEQLVGSQAAVLVVRAAAGFATLDPEAIPREVAASAPCHRSQKRHICTGRITYFLIS